MSQKNKINKIQNESFERTAVFERASVNEDERTVELSFSSEEPVARWFGNEVLGHDADNINLGRLNDGGAVLVDHNHRDLVGTVENAVIDSEQRKGRAVVRFGKSQRAEEIYQDVKDGIRKNVSVGYSIQKMELVEMEGDEETYRATQWTPYEISIVSVPADSTVGVGRSKENPEKENKMSKEVKKPEVNAEEIRKTAVAGEQQRTQNILALGARHNMTELAGKFVSEGRSVNDMKDAVLQAMGERGVSKETDVQTEIGMTGQEVQRFSLLKAVRALQTGNWDGAGFERDCSMAVADKLGRDARGLFIPMEVQRAMGTATGTGVVDAGALVATEHMDDMFIDALRSQSLMGQLGVRILGGLQGDLDIPRLDSGATFSWIEEGADGSETDGSLSTVLMSPKTIAGAVPITRKLLKQSSPSVEAMIREDLMKGAALAIDMAVLNGTGTGPQPLGILNTTGVNTVAVADAATGIGKLTHEEAVAFETAISEDNALSGSLAYITTPAINGAGKTTSIEAGSGIKLIHDRQMNGYDVHATTLMPAKKTMLGNFNDVVVGMWGVLDVTVDTAKLAASGGVVLRAFQDADVAVRHAESFCVTG
ncbi:phage major capsid protein [Thiomicrorhabdus lithotrophica]|uniref:Phage major capsid protein n=1 Tax=Thiomicrorhabdus lithotrophica TaxID=2949997 RepID=A0ABY8C874_9GAMM|nr:phage major capsid protein [Thiomicrorhabdus lithotrophica]WEJ62159.1 phage major capsid protein [Thiomicrorhabdus lithotrophica]